MARVVLQVGHDLVAVRVAVGVAGERPAGQAVAAHGREQPQRVPALAPGGGRLAGGFEDGEAAVLPGQEVADGQAGLAAADHDDVAVLGHADACSAGATSKLNIIPLSWCSAMWQCAIQRPGLVTSSRMSTTSPVRTSTVSLQTRLGSGVAVARDDEEAAGAVDVERVVHRVVGVHLVDQADLHPVADA